DLLAKLSGIAEGIAIVVLHLERNAELSAKFIQELLIPLSRSSANGAHRPTSCEYRGCLQRDHAQIAIEINIIGFFEIHVKLLSLAKLPRRTIEECADGEDVFSGNAVEIIVCGHEHHIACKQCCVFSVLRMHGRHSPSQRSFVHDVVVNEREIMEELDCCGHCPCIAVNFIEEFIAHQAENRSEERRVGKECRSWTS